MMKRILFIRRKIEGENSIEELANTLGKLIGNVEIMEFPEYNQSIIGIVKNILFAIKNQGKVNHFFSPSEVYCAPFIKGKKIVTWHDVATDFKTRNPIIRFLKKHILRYIPMFFCRYITCISENTHQELQRYFPLIGRRIVKIYNPYNPNIKYTPKKSITSEEKIILHLGTGSRKNLENVIKALEGLRCKLYIVGKLSDLQLQLLSERHIDYHNEFEVPFYRIIELYKECDVVSFPSFYEGFGMPIIEGQAIGRPILTSKSGAIPEIAGDSVLYVNPNDVLDIRKGFSKLLTDSYLYGKLVTLGINNVKKYSIEEIVKAYDNLYLS